MTNIGRVDFLVDFDGKKLPAKARAIGRQAGDAAGTAASQRFADKFTPFGQGTLARMSSEGKLAGFRISDAMEKAVESRLSGLSDKVAGAFLTKDGLDNFSSRFKTVDEAAQDLRVSLQELRDSGNLNDEMWGRFGGTLNKWLGTARESEKEAKIFADRLEVLKEAHAENDRRTKEHNSALKKLSDAFRKSSKDADDNSEAMERNGVKIGGLSHNMKQVIAIIAAITAGGQEIAVLGSAAGAGLTILAASAVGLGVGLGVAIAGFQGVSDSLKLLKDRDELLAIAPEDRTDKQIAELEKLQQTIAGFDAYIPAIARMGDAFVAMQDKIQAALLNGLGPTIDSLTNTLLPTLETGFVQIAGALNTAFADLGASLTSPEVLAGFTKIFDDIAAQIPFLVKAIGNIGGAIGGILIAAGPFTLKFVKWLEDITKQFSDFVNSVEGQNSLAEWFSNGERVLKSFGDLLGGAGKLLANLVDEESVAKTEEFLNNLTASLPFFESLLNLFGELDLFGNIANIFNEIGNAVKPLLDYLAPLATLLGESLTVNIDVLATAIQILLIPLQLLTPLFEGISTVISGLIGWFQEIINAYQPVFDAFSELADEISVALKPAFDDLTAAIVDFLPSPEEVARIVRDVVVPAIKDFSDYIISDVVPAVKKMIEKFVEFLDKVGGIEGLLGGIDRFLKGVKFWADNFVAAFGGPVSIVKRLIEVIDILNNKPIIKLPDGASGGRTGGKSPGQASGGINTTPRFGWTGEAGPEAIVPMNRALSQVDPSVRRLSAIIQGKSYAGESNSSGPGVYVAEGAIGIYQVSDGRLAADAALDRFVAMAGD